MYAIGLRENSSKEFLRFAFNQAVELLYGLLGPNHLAHQLAILPHSVSMMYQCSSFSKADIPSCYQRWPIGIYGTLLVEHLNSIFVWVKDYNRLAQCLQVNDVTYRALVSVEKKGQND